jgi:hypothetical protein
MRPFILFASLIIAATPAFAAAKLSPKQLVKSYRFECVDNMKALKKQLAADKVKIKGTKDDAAKSKQLFCSFDATNPTIRQINDKAWLAAQDGFISKKGLKAYVTSTQALMVQRVAESKVDQVLARGKKQGLTPAEVAFLGQITRAMAFAEAHVAAATIAYKE